MAATASDIRNWTIEGQRTGAAYMIVCCDTFDWEDFPIYVTPEQDFWGEGGEYRKIELSSDYKLMEIYDLSLDIEKQLSEFRAYHPPVES